jgi:hypothetical protein
LIFCDACLLVVTEKRRKLLLVDIAIAAEVRRLVEGGGERFWRPADFSDLPPRVVDRSLSRMAAENELRHIRRGLYWHGRKGPFGISRPSAAQTAAAIAGDVAVGPAGVSAANALGLTSQVSPVEVVAVPRRAPEPLATIRFVDRAQRHARYAERLTTFEVALLEVLADWHDLVEVEAPVAQRKIAQLFESGTIRVVALARGAADEPSDVRERLRHILEVANQREAVRLVPPARTPELRRRALEVFDA